MTHNRSTYIAGIDGLRAFAVLSVIIFHFKHTWLPGGFTGVDVFFVISGYVVTGSLLGAEARGLKNFLTAFYARRLARIYPALIFCLLVAVIFKTLLVPKSWLSSSSDYTGLSAFFGLSNFALVYLNDGYFSPRVEFNVFAHTWSLAIEEQFYFIYPCFLYFYLKDKSKLFFGYSYVKIILLFLIFASLGCSFWQSNHAEEHAYYLLPSRFWELGVGALLSIIHTHHTHHFRSILFLRDHRLFSLLGIGSIFYGFLSADMFVFPAPGAIPSVVGTLLVLHGLMLQFNQEDRYPIWLEHPLFVYIGKLSYSLYLWHWPVIVIIRWTLGDNNVGHLFLAFLVTLSLSIFSYHVVEKNFGYLKIKRLFSDGRIILLGCFILFALAVVCFIIFRLHPRLTLSVTGNTNVWYSDVLKKGAVKPVTQNTPRLYVLGDSHVGAYGTLLGMLQREQGWVVIPYFSGGCPVADLLRPASAACRANGNAALDGILSEAKPGDLILLASLRMFRLGDQSHAYSEDVILKTQMNRKTVAKQVFQEANNVIQRLQQAGLRVIIDAPKPTFRSPPGHCSDWFNRQNPVCSGGFEMSRAYLENYRQEVMTAITQLQQARPGLLVWDAFPYLCPNTYCSAFDDHQPLYFDEDHLSGYGNRKIYPYFLAFLRNALATPVHKP